MIAAEQRRLDSLDDRAGRLVAKIRGIKTWTNEKARLVDQATELLPQLGYSSFTSHYKNYGVQRIGDSYLLDVPPAARGHLQAFRGQTVRVVCLGAPAQVLRKRPARLEQATAGKYRSTWGFLRLVLVGRVKVRSSRSPSSG